MKKEKLITVAIASSAIGAVVGILVHKNKKHYINPYEKYDHDDYEDDVFYD